MSTTPAGWFPQEDGRQRYWDGEQWTDHFAPAVVETAHSETPALGSGGAVRPWFKKKRLLIPAGVLTLAVVAAALSPDDGSTPVGASSSTKTPAASSSPKANPASTPSTVTDPAAAKAAADAKEKADAAAKAKAAADAKAKAAADAKAKAGAVLAAYDEAYGTFVPVTKSGRGDAIVNLPKGAAAGLVTFTHKGSSNIAASVLDASNQPTGDLLVNEIGAYRGVTAFGLDDFGGDPTKIQITADGSWSIRIAPVSSAPALGKSVSGKGDNVFRFDGSSSDYAISHKGSSNFAVNQVGGLLPNLVVNEIGNYSGVVPFLEGPSVVTITADGRWSLGRK